MQWRIITKSRELSNKSFQLEKKTLQNVGKSEAPAKKKKEKRKFFFDNEFLQRL